MEELSINNQIPRSLWDYQDWEMALPNLRRLFVEARTEAEENEYSRNAVGTKANLKRHKTRSLVDDSYR